MDNLELIMDKQLDFQERLGYFFYKMPAHERAAYIKEMSIHTNQEMNEMLYELPFFKPWKNYKDMTGAEIEAAFARARKEYVDMLHFFINMGIALGFSADTLVDMYCAKHEINNKRQDEGYTHLTPREEN